MQHYWPPAALLLLSSCSLTGCSWFQSNEVFTCEVEWQCDDCNDLKVTVFAQESYEETSKEAQPLPVPVVPVP